MAVTAQTVQLCSTTEPSCKSGSTTSMLVQTIASAYSAQEAIIATRGGGGGDISSSSPKLE
eukprot:11888063-Ditylum_brightwellii.AAC.1